LKTGRAADPKTSRSNAQAEEKFLPLPPTIARRGDSPTKNCENSLRNGSCAERKREPLPLFWRADPRANNKLATLAQAISNTKADRCHQKAKGPLIVFLPREVVLERFRRWPTNLCSKGDKSGMGAAPRFSGWTYRHWPVAGSLRVFKPAPSRLSQRLIVVDLVRP